MRYDTRTSQLSLTWPMATGHRLTFQCFVIFCHCQFEATNIEEASEREFEFSIFPRSRTCHKNGLRVFSRKIVNIVIVIFEADQLKKHPVLNFSLTSHSTSVILLLILSLQLASRKNPVSSHSHL